MKVAAIVPRNYLSTTIGAVKAPKIIMRRLSKEHDVAIFSRTKEHNLGNAKLDQDTSSILLEDSGVRVELAINAEDSDFIHALPDILREEDPDVIVVSDQGASIVVEIFRVIKQHLPKARLLFLTCNADDLPFGPFSNPNFKSTSAFEEFRAWLEKIDGVLCQSRAHTQYFKKHSNINASYFYPVDPSNLLAENLWRITNPYITMVNLSEIKGASIFLEIVSKCPELKFAAVKSWATSDALIEESSKYPNLTLFEATKNMDEIYRQTRLLLVPSIWFEAFGMVAFEAKIRGIPVLASRSGGIPEALLGDGPFLDVDFVKWDAKGNRRFPPQKIQPWIDQIKTLLNDPGLKSISEQGRQKALNFLRNYDFRNAVETICAGVPSTNS